MADPVSKKIIRETLMNGKISQRIFLDSLPPNVIVDLAKVRALIWVELNNVRETKVYNISIHTRDEQYGYTKQDPDRSLRNAIAGWIICW